MTIKLEKYNNWLMFAVGYAYRLFLRSLIFNLVKWPAHHKLEDGCTVVIGMCSKLPGVLSGNLKCLRLAKWPDLKEVVIAVDTTKDKVPQAFLDQIMAEFKDLKVRFVFYSPTQHIITELLKIPYIYCWLSWCLAIREVTTKHFYIHDYDALLLGDVLKKRYRVFLDTNRLIQGVGWYQTNGIVPDDKLVSTFEAFVDTQWVRDRKPIKMFNQIGLLNGRRLDFDILIEMQIKHSLENQRGIISMDDHEMAHPAQMIHQYTVFRKFPGRPWNCAALVMIPFFHFISGNQEALASAGGKVRSAKNKTVDLLSDGCIMNFSFLSLIDLQTMLQLMIRTFIQLQIKPFKDFRDYAEAFYEIADISKEDRWTMSLNSTQERWVRELLTLV